MRPKLGTGWPRRSRNVPRMGQRISFKRKESLYFLGTATGGPADCHVSILSTGLLLALDTVACGDWVARLKTTWGNNSSLALNQKHAGWPSGTTPK